MGMPPGSYYKAADMAATKAPIRSLAEHYTGPLFFENLYDVFGIDANGFGFAEEKNDMKIFWCAKLSWVIERILRPV
jgi:hypothetical protein